MFHTLTHRARWLLTILILLTGCSKPVVSTGLPAHTLEPTPSSTVAATSPPFSTVEPTRVSQLDVRLLYPKNDTQAQMGQTIKFIAQVFDDEGNPVSDGQVDLTVSDPSGKIAATIPTTPGSDGVYRSDNWPVPHHSQPGSWNVVLKATSDHARGNGSGNFEVVNSTSETLLGKYGFWLDAPTLRGIVPTLVAERGDARNGMIRWGGIIPAQHVYPEIWVEIQWREGNFNLNNPEAVRQFIREDLGDLGITPIRDFGPFERTQFKQWEAWKIGARGQFQQIHLEWIIFYAPEVDKTYAIGTTVVQPPSGVDAHALLRNSFRIDPELHASGVAPEPLPVLLAGPELLSPPLGARFTGLSQPIVLKWAPVKELESDEYYQVSIDYNYREANPKVILTTRQTQVTLPESLYQTPNCQVFNWQVTLMHKTGENADGQPIGVPLSYSSLYWYLQWFYSGERPFPLLCPNAQF